MKRRNPFGSRATRLLAYENARPSESRRQPLKRRLARKDSAVRVSLSSNHNVKEPPGVRQFATSRTPDGSKSPIRSQRQPQRLPGRTQVCSASVRRIARSRIAPREVGTTRAKSSFKEPPPRCQAPVNRRGAAFAFPFDCDSEATFLPECAATLGFVNGEVTIRG
jgi:hypothetical protein